MASPKSCRPSRLTPIPTFVVLISIMPLLGYVAIAQEFSPCTLCVQGQSTPNLEKQVRIDWPVSLTNCSSLDAYAASLSNNSAECADVQKIGTICGCPVPQNACSLCVEGGSITLPSSELLVLKSDFDGVVPTCELFESFLHSIDASTTKCNESTSIGPSCGCSVRPDACDYCKGTEMTEPDKVPPLVENDFTEWIFEPYTCEFFNGLIALGQIEGTDQCRDAQEVGFLCGCNTESLHSRQKLLSWMPRISAILSILGSSYIIYDITRKRERTVQNDLLLWMSVIDCMSSFAWALSSLPMPEETNYYGAKGNDATCKAQAFFIQLGFTVPFFNCSLSVFYLLVVAYGMRDDDVRRYRAWLLAVPLVCGLALAFAAIPFYGVSATMCHVQKDVETFFLTIPIGVVMGCATLLMGKIWLTVYRQEHRSLRWSSTQRMKLSRAAFWQCFWYLMCFYVSWPVVFVVASVDTGLYQFFGLLCAAMFLAPFQGFLNFIAYSRLQIHERWKQRKCFRRKAAEASSVPTSGQKSSDDTD